MKALAGILVMALVAAPAMGATYSWEDGGTILGWYGNLVDPTNVTGPQTGSGGAAGPYTCPGAHSGDRYLHVAEDPHSSTPQTYIAWITGLTDGDVIDASFFGYDITPGSSPSLRIWGHYTETGGTINDYAGSASGNYEYTDGTGWDDVAWSWTFDSDSGTRDGLVVEARLYSTPSTSNPNHTDYWIDDVEVTTTSSTATITFPPPGPPGACCQGLDCTVTSEALCIAAGGDFQGGGTTCEPNPCGPTGACCAPDFDCIDDLTESECYWWDPDATWTEGGTCAEDCIPDTGSCCLLDGSCVVDVNEGECAQMRGRQFTLHAEDCDPPCEPAVLAPVILSEYYESAPGRRKAVEVFNPSPEPASLYGHALGLYSNFNTSPNGVFLLDDITMAGSEVLVFINNVGDDIPNFDEATAILAPSVCNFNGDDAVAILLGDIGDNNIVDVFAVPGERDNGPRGSDPYKDSAWERSCGINSPAAVFDSCNFDGLKDCAMPECPRGTPVDGSCADGANPDEWTFEGRNPYSDNCHHTLGYHAVCVAADLDIKPGSCPNSFNRGSHGVLPVAILGTEDFDVAMIDVSTVVMTRADLCPGSGEVAPLAGPPGPGASIEDVGTPYGGGLCDCHELEGDGIDDLSLKFKTEDVVAMLGMEALPNGALVVMIISGELLDGTPFTSRDCIRLVPPCPLGSALLSVQSNAPGPWIDVNPLDNALDSGGFANFERSFPDATVVTLTAPTALPDMVFTGWDVDGTRVPSASGTMVIEVDQPATTVDAVYEPVMRLLPPAPVPAPAPRPAPTPLIR